MSTKRTIARNVVVNQAGLFVNMTVAFFLMPFLLHRLGQTTYGLWILIGSMTSYFRLLDVGVSSSVGRYVAHHKAREDLDGLNRTVSSALGILGLVALVVLAVAGVFTVLFGRIFEVPPDQVVAVQWAVMLVGLNLALTFPLQVFDGVLWGFQRFDVLNAVDIPVALLRAAATILWVVFGGGLVALAVVTLSCTVLAGILKILLSYRLQQGLQVARRLIGRVASRELFTFGFWNFLRAIASEITQQADRIVIGIFLTPASVPVYHVAVRLTEYSGSLTASMTGVITPEATRRNALDDDDGRRRLLIGGTRVCALLGAAFAALFFALGRDFLTRYLGDEYASSAILLYILGAAASIGVSMGMTAPLLVSMARHRYLAYVGLSLAAANLAISLSLVGPYGLLGVALGAALPRIFSGLFISPWMVCHFTKTKLSSLYLRGLLPAALGSLPCFLLAWALTFWRTVTWPVLFLKGGLIVASFAVVGWFVALSPDERKMILQALSARLRRLFGADASERR